MPGFDAWKVPKVPLYSLSDNYYLYDTFDTDRAAGAVNGTLAEPVGGARTDTAGNTSISGGKLVFPAFLAGYHAYTEQARVLGKTVKMDIDIPDLNVSPDFGYVGNLLLFLTGGTGAIYTITEGRVLVVGTFEVASYSIAVTLRASGDFYFIKGGAFTNWTLLDVASNGTAAATPVVESQVALNGITVDNFVIPKQLYIPTPLQSDGMSAATTDGLGNPESNGPAGNAYTNVGTWGVAAGKRSCSVLSGGLGFSYLPTSSSNVILEAVCTRSAGVTGLVARYADASNYLIAYHDGTNAKLDKVVAGTTTNLISAAATYAAAAVMCLHLDGTSARLFYNNAAVGTVATTPAAGSLNHGVYTTDVNATFDNLVIWARGNENQHNGLNNL